MKRTLQLLLVFAGAAGLAIADDSAPAPTPEVAKTQAAAETKDASSLVLAPRHDDYVPAQPADSDGVARSVSPGVAAALAASMPKYEKPTPTPAVVAEPEDERDIDKPKNEIPRLPKYVVQERRPPVFRQRDLYTAAGLNELYFKAHPGLNIGNIFGLNSSIAKQMIYDDQRLANIEDLNETAYAMAKGGDMAEAQYILKESQDTNMRSAEDFGPIGSLLGGAGK